MTQLLSAELDVLRSSMEQAGVKYALASYVDIHGISKAKAVPLAHFAQMMAGSELFTGAALDGIPQDVSDEEVSARPDPATATVLPWNPEVVWMASDLYLKGAPFDACCRSILKSVLAQAAALGFTFNLGIETEFYVLREDEYGGFVPVSERDTLAKPCYDVGGLLDNYGMIDELVSHMNRFGWDVYSFDHEDGNGQFETDFGYSDALTMADRFIFFRLMAKELAHRRGYLATFMPKPFANRTGSGAHYNISLADRQTGENRFVDPDDRRGCGLSKLGYQFIAGILRHAPAICAVIAPTVNSYKRLIARGSMSGSTWAPIYIGYGNNNRTNMLRIPLGGGRIECRAADMANNPYLGAAMILAAGLEGIHTELDPGEPCRENMYRYSQEEIRVRGIRTLPRTLGEAIDAFEVDPLSERVMGPLMYKTYIDFKRGEWEEYHTHVSDWELRRYLKFF